MQVLGRTHPLGVGPDGRVRDVGAASVGCTDQGGAGGRAAERKGCVER